MAGSWCPYDSARLLDYELAVLALYPDKDLNQYLQNFLSVRRVSVSVENAQINHVGDVKKSKNLIPF